MNDTDIEYLIGVLKDAKTKALKQETGINYAISELHDIIDNHIFTNNAGDIPNRIKTILAMLEAVN